MKFSCIWRKDGRARHPLLLHIFLLVWGDTTRLPNVMLFCSMKTGSFGDFFPAKSPWILNISVPSFVFSKYTAKGCVLALFQYMSEIKAQKCNY